VDRVTDREPVAMMRLVPKLIPALKTSIIIRVTSSD